MALEELLSLITGGMKGYNAQKDAEQRRKQYQQEQAFKQWQVMSDLENKRAQVDQMKAYHEAMAEAARERNRLSGENYGSLAGYRIGQLGNAKLGIGMRALPNVRDEAGLGFLGRATGIDTSNLYPDSFRAPSEVVGMRRADITDRHLGIVDRNAIIARVMASSDPAAAEADANAQLIASGLPPISGRLPQSAAASAAMTNAATGDRNSRFNTDPLGLGGAKIEATRAGAAVNRGLAGLFPLKSKALEADIANTMADTLLKKANAKYATVRTGLAAFDSQLDAQKLALMQAAQRWKENPDSPENMGIISKIFDDNTNALRELRLTQEGSIPLDYNRMPIPREKWTPEQAARYDAYKAQEEALSAMAAFAADEIKQWRKRKGLDANGNPIRPERGSGVVTPPPTRYNADTYPVDPGYAPIKPGTLPNPKNVGAQARAAGAKAGFKPQLKKSAKTPAEKAGVGVKMRKPRTSPKLDSAFGTLGEILKGSPVNPNAGKRPR